MGAELHLALDHLEDLPSLADDERLALHWRQLAKQAPFDAEITSNLAILVGQQRVVEVVLLAEFLLLGDRVDADPHPLGTHPGELGRHVTKMARFRGAARGHRGGVEEQHHGAVDQQGAELAGGAVLVG